MMKSSMGYHTFSLFQRLSMDDEAMLDQHFFSYMHNSGQMKMTIVENKAKEKIGIVYSYKNSTGIKWLVMNRAVGKGFRVICVIATITPMALLNKDYIGIANESHIQKVKSIFDVEASKISPILGDFDSYSSSRVDYCANFDLEELKTPCTSEQMMILIKMGDVPTHFGERTEYNKTSHRPQKVFKNNFYLESGSVVANCYDKHAHLESEENHPCSNKEDAENNVRFEMQHKNRKLNAMSKKHEEAVSDLESSMPKDFDKQVQEMNEFCRDLITRQKSRIPIEALLSNATSVQVIDKYFRKIVRSGDYYTLSKAKHMIESLDCQTRKKEKLIKALENTNRHRGIYNTKSKLPDKELLEYKRMLIELDKLRINPVTIPKEWGIEHIPNLLNAYYDKCTEVQSEELRREWEKRLLRNWSK